MKRLHPATILVALLPKLREAIQAAIPIIIGSFASHRGGNHEWIGIFIVSFTGFFAVGTYWTTRYGIEVNHVVHKTGWIFRKDRRIPLEQIQNVNLRQNVLERLFKVATLDVETAMGRGRDLKLSVLGLADAERFREELLASAHVEPVSTKTIEEPLVTLNRHDLLLGAITENHLMQMMTGLFILWGPSIGIVTRLASKLPPGMELVMFGVGTGLIFFAAWTWSAVSYYLKFGGFVVHHNASAFRISYGLLNKVQLVIRPRRIEFLRVNATLPQRWMKRASFHVGTASSFGEAGILAPVALFVERFRAYRSAEGIIPSLQLESLHWRAFEPVFYRASVTRGLTMITIIVSVATLLNRISGGREAVLFWSVGTFLSTLIVLALLGLFLSKAENGYAITADALVVRRGYVNQSISAMPIERIENISVTQPFWWKKYRAASLSAQAMKNRIHVGAVPETALEELMARWREKVQSPESLKLFEILSDEPTEIPPLNLENLSPA